MNILIIGAAGFIGSNCVNHFTLQGYNVVAADVVPVNGINNFVLLSSANTSFIELFQLQTFDFCINASGAASVPLSVQYPQRDFELNTYNVLKMLDAIHKYNPTCIFINFSSAAVYGNPEQMPIKEDILLKPLSPYGHHKLMAEQICREYQEFFNISTYSLRVFSAYGPGLKKQFFWDLNTKVKTGDVIKLYGTGRESRDFIFIDDILAAVEIVIQNYSSLPHAINVASGTETTMKDAATTFLECVDSTALIEFGGQVREGDPLNWSADVTALKKFGFAPKHNLKQGLEKYTLWLKHENV
jgi:UDP-glucose 4-epimerase